jgi:uncharacterized protein (TIGR00255 family)
MAVDSMTGFGRADGSALRFTWVWEVRSVNGRGLDLRLRLPPGFDALEPKARERVQASLSRGSVTLNLTVKRSSGSATIRVNREAIASVAEAVTLLRAAIPGPTTVNIDGLLQLRGVLDDTEADETDVEAETRQTAMLASLDKALTELKSSRRAEGQRLRAVLAAQIDDVETLVASVAKAPSRSPDAVRARLAEQIARLVAPGGNGSSLGLDAARLHQEAMLIATRVDIDEELKRLTAHVAAARDLLAAKEPVGRKFDFLTQEFNREANTLCSKANDVDITRSGLALKAVIDQMREQVQNIE